MDARKSLDPGAPVIRATSKQTDNHIFDWESGDRALCDRVLAKAEVVVAGHAVPRASSARWRRAVDASMDKVTASSPSTRPRRRRTLTARLPLVAGLPEHKIQIISPDIGGGRQQGRDLPGTCSPSSADRHRRRR